MDSLFFAKLNHLQLLIPSEIYLILVQSTRKTKSTHFG